MFTHTQTRTHTHTHAHTHTHTRTHIHTHTRTHTHTHAHTHTHIHMYTHTRRAAADQRCDAASISPAICRRTSHRSRRLSSVYLYLFQESIFRYTFISMYMYRFFVCSSSSTWYTQRAAKEISLKLWKPLSTRLGDLVPLEGLSYRDLQKPLSTTNLVFQWKISRWYWTFMMTFPLFEYVKNSSR